MITFAAANEGLCWWKVLEKRLRKYNFKKGKFLFGSLKKGYTFAAANKETSW